MKLKWTDIAWDNLERETRYIAENNPITAQAVIRHIFDITKNLTKFPQIGREGRRAGTRELISTRYPYIVVYNIKPKFVEIISILHTARKYPPNIY
jgi:toxin ParE1/3/4